MTKSDLRNGTAFACAMLAMLGDGTAMAQTVSAMPVPASSPPPAEAVQDKESEADIVVTATRREQSLQQVPIAVTAATGAQLTRSNVTSSADLMRIAPTLQITTTNSETAGTTIRIRGVGTAGNNPGLEGAVGVFIDGVYRQRSGLAMNNLFDIDRIEVLRGPQGTLFGKNTSAGAISVTPKAPKLGVAEGLAKAGIGNYTNREVEGMVNVPIGDTVAVRVSGAYQRRDGFIKDLVTGDRHQDLDRTLVRGMLLWEPTDRISWRGTVDYAEKSEDCCAAIYRIAGGATALQNSLVPGAVVPLDPKKYQSVSTPGRPFIEKTKDLGFSSHLRIDLTDDIAFRTIVAHRQFDAINRVDADFGAADIVYQNTDATQKLTSAEATLNGTWGALDWLAGFYYSNESIDLGQSFQYGADLPKFVTAATRGAIGAATAAALYPTGGGNTVADFRQDSTSYSFFTHNQFEITDRLGLVAGLRFNHEEKRGGLVNYVTNSPSCGGGPFDGQGSAAPAGIPAAFRAFCPRPTTFSRIDESEFTGIAGLNYKFSRAIMAYVSYSRGYKAGGFNLDRDAAASVLGINPATGLVTGTQAQVNEAVKFKPEFSNSYEAGIRTQFFDRKLTLNATYFRTTYDDFQLNNFNGTAFSIVNAGSVKTKGFEVEGAWNPDENFSVTYGVSHVIARWGTEPVLQFDPPDNAAPLPPNLPLAGRILNNSPKWSFSTSANYQRDVGQEIKAFANIGLSYRSSIVAGANLNTAKAQDATLLVNGRVGLFKDTQKGWEVAAWVNNLTNTYYRIVGFDTTLQSGSISDFPGQPRMYGLTIRQKF